MRRLQYCRDPCGQINTVGTAADRGIAVVATSGEKLQPYCTVLKLVHINRYLVLCDVQVQWVLCAAAPFDPHAAYSSVEQLFNNCTGNCPYVVTVDAPSLAAVPWFWCCRWW